MDDIKKRHWLSVEVRSRYMYMNGRRTEEPSSVCNREGAEELDKVAVTGNPQNDDVLLTSRLADCAIGGLDGPKL
jgi:hypothetical protein